MIKKALTVKSGCFLYAFIYSFYHVYYSFMMIWHKPSGMQLIGLIGRNFLAFRRLDCSLRG
nr:MAG TPA: hypothetical protein [Caudoviricetes sp.]